MSSSASELRVPVDGVEIKYTVSGSGLDAAVESFGLRPGEAKHQVVYFFDADLRLFTSGVVLRLRGKSHGPGKTTLKLRPAVAERLTGEWAAGSTAFDDYGVEYDWGRSPVLAASMGDEIEAGRIEAVLGGDAPVRTLFSDEQAFLELSARVDEVHEAGPHRTRLGKELARRGLVPDTGATSKTETVLRHFLGSR